jgi:transposase InsO family protein
LQSEPKFRLLCLGKNQRLWNKKLNLSVNGDPEITPSQNFVEVLKFHDLRLIKIIARFENEGYEGLQELSRKPSGIHPNSTDENVVNGILTLKEKHKLWGAKKIHKLLYNDFSDELIPSVLTVHNILKKHGLVKPQKRLRRVKPIHPIFDPKQCNEVWSADYKGKFLMGNKIYCHPLTVADSKSRFVFTAKGHYKESLVSAKAEFTRVFRKYGIPKQIHTDNGSPFGSVKAIQRFTRLSYWFIELGIMPVYSDPSHPEQNGRHERMHRDLKAACAKPSAYDLKAQQRRLNRFVQEYNHVRPHESLGMKTLPLYMILRRDHSRKEYQTLIMTQS